MDGFPGNNRLKLELVFAIVWICMGVAVSQCMCIHGLQEHKLKTYTGCNGN
jgi:hypothetical protein